MLGRGLPTMEPNIRSAHYVESTYNAPTREAHSSGVAWGAVIGGAFACAATYLILLALGAGVGLSTVSPWSNVGAAASTAGAIAIVWLIVIEIISSAFGGYLTGRLRTKWALIHTDEVFFRDTANGFLAWAVALVVSAALLASAAAAMVGVAPIGTEAASGSGDARAYYVDALFRSDQPSAATENGAVRAEAERIFTNALTQPQIPTPDQDYLARLISTTIGISVPDAQRRV